MSAELDIIKKDLEDIIKIQCANGNWNYNSYMHGMANGLILAQSIILKSNPEFLYAPKCWISECPEDKEEIVIKEKSDNKSLNLTDEASAG